VQQAVQIVLSGLFAAAIFFLVAAGLQLVFGVQKILNLACGSFYALGAYMGISAVRWALAAGLPEVLFPLALIAAGLVLGVLGPPIERLLSTVYQRDEAFQLLLTFALALIIEDVTQLIWGATPQSTGGLYLIYGQLSVFGVPLPVYNLLVILASFAIAALIGGLLTRTAFGRILRATADNRAMGEALGVDVRRLYAQVFTIGLVLGTLGGALVVPAIATRSEMGIDLLVEAFAAVVIGGLGSMRGALVAALLVGLVRAVAIATYPPAEMLVVYLLVIAVLVLRPSGLFGRPVVA
jgi:branched-chain amino acid transport system permease protein